MTSIGEVKSWGTGLVRLDDADIKKGALWSRVWVLASTPYRKERLNG